MALEGAAPRLLFRCDNGGSFAPKFPPLLGYDVLSYLRGMQMHPATPSFLYFHGVSVLDVDYLLLNLFSPPIPSTLAIHDLSLLLILSMQKMVHDEMTNVAGQRREFSCKDYFCFWLGLSAQIAPEARWSGSYIDSDGMY